MDIWEYLCAFGFLNSRSHTSLFICHHSGSTIFLIVQIDDIILTANKTHVLEIFIANLGTKFSIKDMRLRCYFFGVEVEYMPTSLFLSQRKYVFDLYTCTSIS